MERSRLRGFSPIKSLSLTVITVLSLGFFAGCSDPPPRLEDYLGTYRIIKIEEKGETVKTPVLNNLELTDKYYIYRFDRNGDNRFSPDEILSLPLDFGIDNGNHPFLLLNNGSRRVGLEPHDYYDLLFQEGTQTGAGTILYARKVIPPREEMNYVKERKKLIGEYEIIKFRENETILNIGNTGRIQITEDLYISEMDRNSDSRIEDEERMVSAYEFHRNDRGESWLLINRDNVKVLPFREDNFDLLLRRIDDYGNDVIMYLKRQ